MSPMHTWSWSNDARRIVAAASLAACTMPLGCDADGDVEWIVDDDVERVVEHDDAEILPLVAAGHERPCGDDTVAVVQHESGVTLSFCELDDGVIAIGESGPEGTPSVLKQLHEEPARVCPADLFRAVAPEAVVPAALERPCDDNLELLRAPELRMQAEPAAALVGESDPQALLGNYCGGSGPNNFNVDWCQYFLDGLQGDPSSYYCINNQLWGWHDRSMSGQLGGEEGDWGEETVAACGGSIRFRAFWRWDVGDAWVTSLDVSVGAGGWYNWTIAEIHGSEDIDVRFRVDSQGGTHRHAGVFEDW